MNNPFKIIIKVELQDISYLNKIFEGYDNLAIVTTLNRRGGLIALTVTPETKNDVLDILNNFPKKIIFI